LQGVELASFQSRACAFLVDAVLIGAAVMITHLWTRSSSLLSSDAIAIDLDFRGIQGLGIALLYFGLATFFGRGATIGKRLMGIRVVSLVHRRLSLWHCVERFLGYAASSLEAGFGFLQYFTHPNRQTVHDRIAETIVVVNRSASQAKPLK
jgi:uncharacterized RDD family membrane protein YckC